METPNDLLGGNIGQVDWQRGDDMSVLWFVVIIAIANSLVPGHWCHWWSRQSAIPRIYSIRRVSMWRPPVYCIEYPSDPIRAPLVHRCWTYHCSHSAYWALPPQSDRNKARDHPQVRGLASGVAATSNWLANAVVSQTFLTLTLRLGGSGTFWLYSVIAAAGLLWVYLMLPETNGAPCYFAWSFDLGHG